MIRVSSSLKRQEQKQGDWFGLLQQSLENTCKRSDPGQWQSQWRKERDSRNSWVKLENQGVEGLEVAEKLYLSTFN